MDSQSSNFIDRLWKTIGFAGLLYPINRIFSIKQVLSSYTNPNIKSSNHIITECTQYGIRQSFRGCTPYLIQLSSMLAISHLSFRNIINTQKDIKSLVQQSIILCGYLLTYPLEIIRIRMTADIQRNKMYGGIRDCLYKIRKNQGVKTLYRGLFLGILQFQLWIHLTQNIFKFVMNNFNDKSSLNCILSLSTSLLLSQMIIHPLETTKKLYQINGSLGHTNTNYKIVQIIRKNKYSLYNGFIMKTNWMALFWGLQCYIVSSRKNIQKD